MFKFRFDGITRDKYKTDEAYARAVYRLNKDRFNEPVKEEGFVNMFKTFREEGLDSAKRKHKRAPTIRQSFEEMANMQAFTSKEERAADNLIASLKERKEYDRFRNLLRDSKTGSFVKFEKEKLEWNQDEKRYEYYDPRIGFIIGIKFGTYEVSLLTNKDFLE